MLIAYPSIILGLMEVMCDQLVAMTVSYIYTSFPW